MGDLVGDVRPDDADVWMVVRSRMSHLSAAPAAPVLRLDDQLCFATYAASNAIVRSYRPTLARLGLSYPQYLVLMVLWERDGVAVKEIAERLDLSSHGVTPVLARRVKARLVRRTVDRADARIIRVHLTAKGARLEQAAVVVQEKVACDLGLEPDAYDALRDQLRALAGLEAGTDRSATPGRSTGHR